MVDELSITQAELAKRCGLKPAAIGLFEQGRRRPCLRNFLKLCDGLRCTPNDILLHHSVIDVEMGPSIQNHQSKGHGIASRSFVNGRRKRGFSKTTRSASGLTNDD
jgi:transcriptional regulator with XRE-family HTH domain